MSRAFLLRGLLALGLLLPTCAPASWAQVPATLQWQNLLPSRYSDLICVAELPGHRLLHAGSIVPIQPTQAMPLPHYELAFTVSTASGDTVRLVRPRPLPPGIREVISTAQLTPDYQVVTVGVQYVGADYSTFTNFMAAFDTTGRQLWYRTFTLPPTGLAYGPVTVGDGYLLLTSAYRRVGGVDLLYAGLLKTDFQGNVRWQRPLDSPGLLGSGTLWDFIASPDGSYLAVGTCTQAGATRFGALQQDFWLQKLRPNGDTIAQARFGQRNVYEWATNLRLMPDGGLALSGVRDIGRYNYVPLLVRLDSLWQPQWELRDPFFGRAGDTRGFTFIQPTTGGDVLLGGALSVGLNGDMEAFMTCLDASAGGGTALRWTRRQPPPGGRRFSTYRTAFFTPTGDAYLRGISADFTSAPYAVYPRNHVTLFTKFANVGIPYRPDLCARPPVAYFAASATAPATVAVLEASTPGPRYGELVAWDWAWGDGSRSSGPAPGPHTYAGPPPVGTPVTLTVTNSLGCTATRTEYPFGQPTAVALARALSARLVCWPSPGSGPLAVGLGGLRPQPPARLTVLNALGQAVREATAPVQQGRLAATLDLGGLPAGVYAVRVAVQEGTALGRVVRE